MTWEIESSELSNGNLFTFKNKSSWTVPKVSSGVYTIWNGNEFLYVGMSGKNINEMNIEQLRTVGGKKGLITRLESHWSGQRSGDQFCVYISDLFVLQNLSSQDIVLISKREKRIDDYVRDYIRNNLSFRYVLIKNVEDCFSLEKFIQIQGLNGKTPSINGKPTNKL